MKGRTGHAAGGAVAKQSGGAVGKNAGGAVARKKGGGVSIGPIKGGKPSPHAGRFGRASGGRTVSGSKSMGGWNGNPMAGTASGKGKTKGHATPGSK
jgi:hypothetical protein